MIVASVTGTGSLRPLTRIRMAMPRTVRAVSASRAVGLGRALTPVVTMNAPAARPMPTRAASSPPRVRANERVLMLASSFRRHHRETHLRIDEKSIAILRRAEVIRLALVRRAGGGGGVEAGRARQPRWIERRLHHRH